MFTIPKNPLLDAKQLEKAAEILSRYDSQQINQVNWPDQFPEKPNVSFQMAHNGTELFIRFVVQENQTLAQILEDNGEVWTDSCVEFFIALDESGYYNFELTCIGKALLGFRKERPHATHATSEIMQSIKRLPSLGKEPFTEKALEHPWELTVSIPISTLFKHQIQSWDGLEAKINLYKCGDNLTTPHYLSWAPIDTENPNFHVPRCFQKVYFSEK